jgi:hypothetical protein
LLIQLSAVILAAFSIIVTLIIFFAKKITVPQQRFDGYFLPQEQPLFLRLAVVGMDISVSSLFIL